MDIRSAKWPANETFKFSDKLLVQLGKSDHPYLPLEKLRSQGSGDFGMGEDFRRTVPARETGAQLYLPVAHSPRLPFTVIFLVAFPKGILFGYRSD
jgi:hypothetical protein